MSEFKQELNEYRLQGYDEDFIKKKINSKTKSLMMRGYDDEFINKYLGFVPQIEKEIDPEIVEPIQNFWQKHLPGLTEDVVQAKTKLVGEEAEWGKYWERGLGKTNVNLALQYHSGGKLGLDWKKAMSAEPDDTGILERYLESLVALGGDTPTFLPGAALGALTGNPFAVGFGAGFVNDSVKAMYMEALNNGKVDGFSEWYDIFLRHGMSEGFKGGLTVGSIAIAPALAGRVGAAATKLKRTKPISPELKTRVKQKIAGNISKDHLIKFASQYTALTGVGAAIEGELPDANHLINNALILGTFGIGAKGFDMVKNRTVKTTKDHAEVVNEVLKEPQMKEDAVSLNKKTFRKDKEFDQNKIKELQEKYKTLEKQLEEGLVKKNKEQLISEKEILNEKLNQSLPEKQQLETIQKIDNIETQIKQIESGKETKVDTTKITVELGKIEKQLENLESPIIQEKVIKTKNVEGLKTEAEKNIASQILEGEVKVKSTKSIWGAMKDIKEEIQTKMFDKHHPILSVVERAEKAGYKLPKFVLNAYERTRNTHGMIGRAFHFLNKELKPLDFKTKEAIPNSKSLIDLLEPIKTSIQYTQFQIYAVAKRTVEMASQKKESGIALKDAKEVIKLHEKQYGQIFKELNEYQNYIAKYLLDSGVLSKENYKLMLEMNKNYIPLHRINDPSVKGSTFSQQIGVSPIKRQYGTEGARKRREKLENEKNELTTKLNNEREKGSVANKELIEKLGDQIKEKTLQIQSSKEALQILDPVETVYLNTIHFIQIAERNSALQSLVKIFKERPEAFPEVTKEKGRLKEYNITKEIEKITGEKISETAGESFSIFRRDGQNLPNKTQIAVLIEGKREVWNVGAEIAEAVRNMNIDQMNMFMRFASVPARTLRAGATLDPAFMAKNFNRDTVTGAVISKYWENIPYLTSLTGLFHMMGKTEMYQKFTKSPAMQSMLVSMDRNYFREGNVQAELTGRKVLNYVNPKNAIETLRIIAEGLETSARLGDFIIGYRKLSKDKTLTEAQKLDYLGFDARNLTMDFARMGSKVQGLNRISAFFAATLGGPYRTLEAIQQRPVQVVTKAASWITLPSVLLWMDNHKSEVYQEIPQWQKDLFWIVIQNEGEENQTVWRIPKPFDLGILFGSIPERILDYIYLNDKNAVQNTLINYGKTLVSSAMPLPNSVVPIFEDKVNRSFFFDRPIVPRNAEQVLSEYQYTPYTSETAKLIGKAISKVTDYEMGSPAKIDNYIRAWTGGLGGYVVDIMDWSLKNAGITNPPPKPLSGEFIKDLAEIPIIKAFVVRTPSATSQSLETFWENYQKVIKRKNTYDLILRKYPDDIAQLDKANKMFFDTEEGTSYAEKFNMINDTKKTITELKHLIDMFTVSQDMESNEKKQLIDLFYTIMIDAAKESNKKMDSLNQEFDIY